MKSSLFVIAAGIAVVAACGKKDAEPSAAASTAAPGSAVATPPAPSSAATSTARHPWIDEAGRGGASCVFTRWAERDGKKTAMFMLTMPPGRDVDTMQTWQFYYDKAGKHLTRYPSATFFDKSQPEQALGETGTGIPATTDVVECEISRITFKDKTFWFNANLVKNFPNRPKGGYPAEDLKAQTGEKVAVEVVDPKTGRVKLKNLSNKDIRSLEVDIIYFKPDRTHEYISDFNLDVTIKPGETVEKTIGPNAAKNIPASFSSVDAGAPSVKFADGTEWVNQNLSGFELPG